MGTWLGHEVAARILWRMDRHTVFAERPFPGRLLFRGGS